MDWQSITYKSPIFKKWLTKFWSLFLPLWVGVNQKSSQCSSQTNTYELQIRQAIVQKLSSNNNNVKAIGEQFNFY